MIPVPEYLYQYASELNQRNNRLSFKLKCFRGQNAFMLLENYFSAGEKQLIKEYEEKLPNIGLHTIHGGIDTKSKPYHYYLDTH